MKTIETVLYSYDELTPEAQERVFQDWQELACNDPYLLEHVYDEIQASLKGLCDCVGVRLSDWSYGPYDMNHTIRVSGSPVDLDGRKALAHVVRALVNAGYEREKTFQEFRQNAFIGVCPFTGCFYDDALAEKLVDGLLEGADNIGQAFDWLSADLCNMCESEQDYLTGKDWFLESVTRDAEVYSADGELID